MDTTKKGDLFEKKALSIIKQLINDGRLGVIQDSIKIYEKHSYYSQERNGAIVFDLVIEVWPPGSARSVLTYFIECKDYESSISVNHIQNFVSSIQQISKVNTKAIFITNSRLQKGAMNYAQSTGVMVIQGQAKNRYDIVLDKSNIKNKVEQIPYSSIDTITPPDGALFLEKFVDGRIISILGDLLNIIEDDGVEYLSGENIKNIALNELLKINSEVQAEGFVLSIEDVEKYATESLGIEIIYFDSQKDLLGRCSMREKKIWINSSLLNTQRYLFVLTHEIGHFILHQNVHIDQESYNQFSDSEYNFRIQKRELNNPRTWIEWQANQFASGLIMPDIIFVMRLNRMQKYLQMPLGVIYLNDDFSDRRKVAKLLDHMSKLFHVSRATIHYKLNELHLLIDKSKLQPIGKIISENMPEYLI